MDGLPSTLFYGFLAGAGVITFFVVLFAGLGRRPKGRIDWENLIPDDPNDVERDINGSPRYPGL